MIENTTKESVSALNSLLQGELSAVETYRQAVQKIAMDFTSDFVARRELDECQAAHQQRVERLRDVIVQLGGEPASTSGAWGTFARLIEGGAKLAGPKAAISALEEGEDHGVKEYRTTLEKLDVRTRDLISRELLPGQLETHRTLSVLKKTLQAS